MSDREFSDTFFTLNQLFEEMMKRHKLSPYRWMGQPDQTPPDYCACKVCRLMRLQLLDDLHEGINQETCPNHQHRQYCEEHERFFHHMDECPDCKNQPRGVYSTFTIRKVCHNCGNLPCNCNSQGPRQGFGGPGPVMV